MLAAMLREGENVWFFKVLGAAPAVAETLEGVKGLLGTVALEPGQEGPKWDLPAGWTQKPASGMRFATVEIPTSQGTIELTVTPLRAVGEPQEYALANVNRWRQQLGLGPIEATEAFGAEGRPGAVVELEARGGKRLQFVDLAGEGAAETAAAAAAHPPLDGSGGPLPAPGVAVGAAGPGLTYATPEGWTAGKTDGMRKAAFVVQDGSASAEVTVIALAAGSGDLLSNVNRWREQVGLAPIDATALAGAVTEMAVHDAKGQYVELVGPPEAPARESTLGVIVPRGDQEWYFKMKGEAGLVERQREAFKAFVRSVQFARVDGADHGA
jgi:hypothetical protein